MALLLGSAMMLGGPGPADAAAEDLIRDLLFSAVDVEATGFSPTQIFVSWRDHSLIETGYRIETSDSENGIYTPAGTTKPCVGVDEVCGQEITLGPPSDQAPRWVRVVPFVSGTVTIPGGPTINLQIPVIDGRPSDPDPALLGAPRPTGLQCNGGSACDNVNSITLTWQDNATDEAFYWVMRARGLKPVFEEAPHRILPRNTTSFSEILTEYSTLFHYQIKAIRERRIDRIDGTSVFERSFSSSDMPPHVSVLTAPVPPPADPSDLTATFTPPSTATLEWRDNSDNEDGWFVDSAPQDGEWQFTASMPATPGVGRVRWSDSTIPPDTVRCYRVRAWRLGPAYSGYTNSACIAGSVPRAPSNLTAVAPTSAEVRLAWVDNSNSESEFVVQRCAGACTSSSTWTDIGVSPMNTPAFADGSVNPLTQYSYRVYARNSLGRSGFSNIAVVTTPKAAVAQPTNLRVDEPRVTSRQIPLLWTDNATDETSYRIEYRPPGDDWDLLATIPAHPGTGTMGYTDGDTLMPKQTRCYRVRAVKGADMSSASNETCGTTTDLMPPDGAPTNLSATVISNERIDLTWTDHATNEESFRVDYVVLKNVPCSQVPVIEDMPWRTFANAPARAGTGTTTYQAKPLQPHSAYFFRVSAANRDGVSAPSNSTGCAQTLGPRLPVFVSPDQSGDLDTTRCHVEIKAPTKAPEVEVGKVRLLVIATIPTGWVTDVRELDRFDPQNPYTPGPGDVWTFGYKFRKGITYRLRAFSLGTAPTRYSSAMAELTDLKVLADCPGDEIPG